MATKARQQYFADEVSLSKEKREFSIADEIQQKIDSIEEGAQVNKIETVKVNGTALVPDTYKAVDIDVPEVIDNLYTIDSDNALSAKQGKVLYDYIQNIASRGRFLSNWNSATGLPMTNPSESPYPYKSGDYFIVSNVAGLGGTNYRPDGSSYIIGQASTVVETDSVDVSDFYFYDGTNWLLLKNSGRSGAVDSSLSTTSTNPVENRVITNALNGKQETLIAGNNIQIAADGKTISATDTTYSAGTNISIDANNEISAVDTKYTAGTNVQISAQNVISATDTKYTAGTNVQISNQNVISATDTKYTAGTGINIDANNVISNTQTSAEWGNITGTLSDQTDLQNALDAKADDTAVVHNTGNETVAGIKTFSSSPIIPAPTNDTDAATKKYVDDQVSAATAGAVSDTAYGSSWNGVTGIAPSKNAVYDKISAMDTTISGKANDSDVVKLTGDQTIAGTKTFSTSPVVPSKTTDATNTGTAIATEAQVYKKQDTLVSGTNIKTINSTSLLGSGDIAITEFTPGGTATTGYVVTKTASGYEWQAPTGGIEVDPNSPIQLTKIWAGTQTQYDALASYDSTTVYLTI